MRAKATLLAVALSTLTATPGRAAPDTGEAIERYGAAADDFDRRDERKQVAHEIGTLRAWIGEARAYRKTDDEEELLSTLQRAKVMVRLIDALLMRGAAENAAREAHAVADAKERDATAARTAAYELEQQLAEMEKGEKKP